MTQEHPITPPPPELVLQWIGEFFGCTAGGELSDSERFLTTRAAQWGADQELEACCEWLKGHWLDADLRATRRPKPPSHKQLALIALTALEACAAQSSDTTESAFYIRRALESLPD